MADLATDVDPIPDGDIDDENDIRFPIRKAAVAGWLYATTAQIATYVRNKLFGSLAGQEGKVAVVNGAETGFEFADLPDAGEGSPMVAITQEDYDALSPPDAGTYYFIID